MQSMTSYSCAKVQGVSVVGIPWKFLPGWNIYVNCSGKHDSSGWDYVSICVNCISRIKITSQPSIHNSAFSFHVYRLAYQKERDRLDDKFEPNYQRIKNICNRQWRHYQSHDFLINPISPLIYFCKDYNTHCLSVKNQTFWDNLSFLWNSLRVTRGHIGTCFFIT